MRLAPGSRITLLDDTGTAFATRIETLDSRSATGLVLSSAAVTTEPPIALTLYPCLLKRDRFEWVLQKGTELGVQRFVPVISSRTVARVHERAQHRYNRWRAIIREAAEQSARGRLPVLEQPLGWSDALDSAPGLRLLSWEEASEWPPSVSAALTSTSELSLLIGPEGGISRDEAAEATARRWQTVSLGPRILRAETAAIAATTLVLHLAGALA